MRRYYLQCSSNIRSDITTEIKNNFSIQFYVKPQTVVDIKTENGSGTSGSGANPFLMTPLIQPTTSEAGLGVVVGTNGIMVVERASSYSPCVCVAEHNIGQKWTWVAITVENRRATVWINGVKIRTGVTGSKTNVVLAHTFGGGEWGSYNGGVMEVSYFDYVLTEKEIIENVKKGTWQLKNGLVAYYKCIEGEGTAIRDSVTGQQIELGVEAWEIGEVEFYPYIPPRGKGIMYNTKSYTYDKAQILHRGVMFRGKNGEGGKAGLLGANYLEGADIGDAIYRLSIENATFSYGEKSKVDIYSEIESTQAKEEEVNGRVFSKINNIFPPSSAFKSGSFDNYEMVIKNLEWGNANFLAFSTSAKQKLTFRRGEHVVANDEFLVGDVRGYQLIKKNVTTEIVYDGELEVYPKNKSVEIAFLTLLDRPRVFDIFNSVYPPEYEFNPDRDEDSGIIRPPHAECFDLYESFNPYTFKDSLISLNGSVPIIRKSLKDDFTMFSKPMIYYENVEVRSRKEGDSFVYGEDTAHEFSYNRRLVGIVGSKVAMRHNFGEVMEMVENKENSYRIFEAPFDITEFKTIEHIEHD